MAEARKRSSGALLVTLLFLAVLSTPLVWLGFRGCRQNQIASNARTTMAMLHYLKYMQAAVYSKDLDRNGTADFWAGGVSGLIAFLPSQHSFAPYSWDPGTTISRDVLEGLAAADPSRPDARPYHGYWYTSMEFDVDGRPYREKGRMFHPTAFAFYAYPARPGIDGHNHFMINEGGSVWSSWSQKIPLRQWPVEAELRKAWSMPN